MENNNVSYTILKEVSRPIIKLNFKLQVENQMIVPAEGPVIICANHLHKRDQLSVFYSTRRPIHYMAKKEYFEKEPTRTMYKLWGAIPTDRSNGKEAMNICQELLNQGEAIGIFPEGTRNTIKPEELEKIYKDLKVNTVYSLKELKKVVELFQPKISQLRYLNELLQLGMISEEEINDYFLTPDLLLKKLLVQGAITENDYDNSLLLPLKMGAIKLAQSTGAPIITGAGNGEFKTGLVRFAYGEKILIPSHTPDEELEQYNEQLRQSIIKTYKKIR